MIPLLTIDKESVEKNWAKEEDRKWVYDYVNPMFAGDIPTYQCDDNWVRMGVFKEFKKCVPVSEFFEYGYCDTEESLVRYLKQYTDDTENQYFVEIGTMSMDYEKYYKNGSYVNKDGVDTGEDYYQYIDEHPEMKVSQDIKNEWITFAIYKIIGEMNG